MMQIPKIMEQKPKVFNFTLFHTVVTKLSRTSNFIGSCGTSDTKDLLPVQPDFPLF